VRAGSGSRVDSQAPLIHAGALRRSEPAPLFELLLFDFAARKALIERQFFAIPHYDSKMTSAPHGKKAANPRRLPCRQLEQGR
jgi:hypothetical protein